jgi:hypothetical protein
MNERDQRPSTPKNGSHPTDALEEMNLDQALLAALEELAPPPCEQAHVDIMMQNLAQRIEKKQHRSPKSLSSLAIRWSAALAVCVVFFGSLPLGRHLLSPQKQPSLSEKKKNPSHPKGQTTGDLTSKGHPAQQITFHIAVRHEQQKEWRILRNGEKILPQSRISMSFSLHGEGGYATLLWSRPQQELSPLYASKRKYIGHKLHHLQKGAKLIQYPLTQEAEGSIVIYLLQTTSPISSNELEQLQHISLQYDAPPHELQEKLAKELHQKFIASTFLSLTIAKTLEKDQR